MRWIFIRGLARERGHWGDFLERCEKALGWRCLALDIPGCGQFHNLQTPETIAEIRIHLQQQLKQLELKQDQPIGLVGLSLGGMVALDWAQAAPEKVKGLILINSSSRLSPFWQRLRLSAVQPMSAALLSRDMQSREKRALQLVSNTQGSDGKTLECWLDIQAKQPVTRDNSFRMLLAAMRYRPNDAYMSNVDLSVCLVVSSKADRLVSYRCSETLSIFLNAALVLHDLAGHDLPMDAPEWLLEQFIQHTADFS